GSDVIMDEKLTDEEIEKKIEENLTNYFRPEFLNRIDEKVIFKKLGADTIEGIVKIQLDKLLKRLEEQKIFVKFTDAAISYLAKKGYDPVYGARPLKRVIQNEIINVMSKKLLAQEIMKGETVKVDAHDLGLQFSK